MVVCCIRLQTKEEVIREPEAVPVTPVIPDQVMDEFVPRRSFDASPTEAEEMRETDERRGRHRDRDKHRDRDRGSKKRRGSRSRSASGSKGRESKGRKSHASKKKKKKQNPESAACTIL